MSPPVLKLRRDRVPDGAAGWDEYAAFYDWENAQTVGRRDVPFWQLLARRTRGQVLELGAGTGRLTLPLARAAGRRVIGIDRSAPMLARAVQKAKRLKAGGLKPSGFVRGDIRALPFRAKRFTLVIAPYGMLQSLTSERDLGRLLKEVARVLVPGGVFGIDLVPDLPVWEEYRRSVRLRGRVGSASIRLIESVRQDRRRGVTIFDQEFVTSVRGRRPVVRRFSLAFRTLPVPKVVARLEKAGFDVEHILGDYIGGAWDERADVWLVLARRAGRANGRVRI
ncbi:MAG: class I SAM-dependent methyltransferase [Acidobacteria bacterium]|nr:MAG: class I SAM-dependent methyltransferase [Acidobacteriota bacterium]